MFKFARWLLDSPSGWAFAFAFCSLVTIVAAFFIGFIFYPVITFFAWVLLLVFWGVHMWQEYNREAQETR